MYMYYMYMISKMSVWKCCSTATPSIPHNNSKKIKPTTLPKTTVEPYETWEMPLEKEKHLQNNN